jgi:hypothetical protein
MRKELAIPDTIVLRRLNRTLLARQHLLARTALPAEEMVETLVGMQAQVPQAPYVGLWSRIADFDPGATGQLVEQHRLVRLPLMRATLHLATAQDALDLRPVIQASISRVMYQSSPYGRAIEGLDVDELIAAGRAVVEAEPVIVSELGRRLQARWPEYDSASLGYAVQYLTAHVQVPPRGVWGRSAQPKLTTLEWFLGRPMSADTGPDALILRYLAAFGPATVRDAQAWSGMQNLADAFDRLRPRLRTYRDEKGRELVDITDGVIADETEDAPVRFLPDYDNVCLAHADRSRIVSDIDRRRAGIGTACLLLDGFVQGTWKLDRAGDSAILVITPFHAFTKPQRSAIEAEGHHLLEFLAPTRVPAVQFINP